MISVNPKDDIEIRETALTDGCKGFHRLFALEFISNESSKVSIIPLACTQCGTLILHKVHAK